MINKYFEKSIKSPEGKAWAQDLWLNLVQGTQNIFGNASSKTDNGNTFAAEIDFNIKTSGTGKEYVKGSLTLGEEKFDISVFPTSVPTFPDKKFQGSIRRVGEKESAADVDVIAFNGAKGLAYKLRLKAPYVRPEQAGEAPATNGAESDEDAAF